MDDMLKLLDGVRDAEDNGPNREMSRSLAYLSCASQDPMGRGELTPVVFVVLQGARHRLNQDEPSEYVKASSMDFLNYDNSSAVGPARAQFHSALAIGILVILKKCPYYTIDIVGSDVKRFAYGDMKAVYSQPVILAPAIMETAKTIMRTGGFIPRFSVGFAAYPGSPGFWELNGPDPESPDNFFAMGSGAMYRI